VGERNRRPRCSICVGGGFRARQDKKEVVDKNNEPFGFSESRNKARHCDSTRRKKTGKKTPPSRPKSQSTIPAPGRSAANERSEKELRVHHPIRAPKRGGVTLYDSDLVADVNEVKHRGGEATRTHEGGTHKLTDFPLSCTTLKKKERGRIVHFFWGRPGLSTKAEINPFQKS